MNIIFDLLQRKPIIGLTSSIGAGAFGLSLQTSEKVNEVVTQGNPAIEAVTPYLSLIALGIGVTVGILTIWLKVMEIREKRKNKS